LLILKIKSREEPKKEMNLKPTILPSLRNTRFANRQFNSVAVDFAAYLVSFCANLCGIVCVCVWEINEEVWTQFCDDNQKSAMRNASKFLFSNLHQIFCFFTIQTIGP
jgi:hypothetical protein